MSERGNVPYPVKDLDSFTLTDGKSPKYDNSTSQPELRDTNAPHEEIRKTKSEKTLPKLFDFKGKFKMNNKNLQRNSTPEEESKMQQSAIFIVKDDKKRPSDKALQHEVYQEVVPQRRQPRQVKPRHRQQAMPQLQPKLLQPIVPTVVAVPSQMQPEPLPQPMTLRALPEFVFGNVDFVINTRFPSLIPYSKHVKVTLIVLFLIQFHWFIELFISAVSRNVYQ
ncbi:unnamed protein product [Kluyveromyces dobzhanskii CBS 2104]|uniref:WGS project CCBQ000000000 data, contig 00098 n=1 Tax=Kluyveromyces dobzhanskii CBS 2104 TaxID=1427455 RepID=A0A0A8L5N3_9SACH|nr:unnamed protein product [Kluyveromyces dobzhanskii CBS 2104]